MAACAVAFGVPAYVVADIEVNDHPRYDAYKRVGEKTVAQYGGKILVRGPAAETLEEGWFPKRVLIIEFADKASARKWFNSPEYREARDMRRGAAKWRAFIVDAYTPG